MASAAAIAFVTAACAGSPARPVGLSHAEEALTPRGTDGGATGAGGASREPPLQGWPGAFARVGAGAALGHGVGRWDVEIHANAVARDAGARAPGAAFVAIHRDKRGEAGPTYAMERAPAVDAGRAGGWRFVALDARGAPMLDAREDEPAARACARCHAEAPRDGVFPPPP